VQRQRRVLGAFGVHHVLEIELAPAGVDIDGRQVDPPGPVAREDLIANVKEDDDRRAKVGFEEGFCVGSGADRLCESQFSLFFLSFF
jgi:hypothetical protein